MTTAERDFNKPGREDWLTPTPLLMALGPFQLDPCASRMRKTPYTQTQFTCLDDGFTKRWKGFVWLNPPYGTQTGIWLKRLADHGNGLALVFSRTDNDWFHGSVMGHASAIWFFKRRLKFERTDAHGKASCGRVACGSMLVAYGRVAIQRMRRLQQSPYSGSMVIL